MHLSEKTHPIFTTFDFPSLVQRGAKGEYGIINTYKEINHRDIQDLLTLAQKIINLNKGLIKYLNTKGS